MNDEDFTEAAYGRLLAAAARRFEIRTVTDALTQGAAGEAGGIAAWRHDVDLSPQRARALAGIEAAQGVRSTFFVLLSGPFYNPLEEGVTGLFQEIQAMGHEIGLHFDAAAGGGDPVGRLRAEAEMLSCAMGSRIRTFSLHNPSVSAPEEFTQPHVGGLMNATAESLRAPFVYASDSNGFWRFRSMHEVVADESVRSLYALTHPEWWTPEPMSPAERVRRCVQGRAAAVVDDYVNLIARHRPEVLHHVR